MAVACGSGYMCFRPSTISSSSRVLLKVAFSFLNVYSATFRKSAGNLLNFIASIFSGSILGIVWNKYSQKSSFSFLLLKIIVFVDTGFSLVAARGRCWVVILRLLQLDG